jgi:hypothetical protein
LSPPPSLLSSSLHLSVSPRRRHVNTESRKFGFALSTSPNVVFTVACAPVCLSNALAGHSRRAIAGPDGNLRTVCARRFHSTHHSRAWTQTCTGKQLQDARCCVLRARDEQPPCRGRNPLRSGMAGHRGPHWARTLGVRPDVCGSVSRARCASVMLPFSSSACGSAVSELLGQTQGCCLLVRDAASLQLARLRADPPVTHPAVASSSAPPRIGTASHSMLAVRPAPRAISSACPAREKPVTSVMACTPSTRAISGPALYAREQSARLAP